MGSHRGDRASVALILSYVLDWIIIIAAAGVGAAFSRTTPNKRPFSILNPDISFPYVVHEKISSALLIICSLIIPAVIILFVALVFVPGPTVPKSVPKALIWRRKLWEWHAGWLGLALSLVAAFLITSGMKNLSGKPRPDLLSRCSPDLANMTKFAAGGYLDTQGGVLLVTPSICQNTDIHIMNDAFRSFPSGHSSTSAAGLVYLSLFLASKLTSTIPFLSPSTYSRVTKYRSAFPYRAQGRIQRFQQSTSPTHAGKEAYSADDEPSNPTGHNDKIIALRNQAAAPPVYLLVFAVIPFFAAIYIASTRWSDFRHHGFDIFFGFFIGTTTAIFSFRYYHLPINQGAGWSWGPRSRDRSFWAGVGIGNYVASTNDDMEFEKVENGRVLDVELGAIERDGDHVGVDDSNIVHG
ncbi:Phosphatidate phosphatase/4-nitrophenylphosphatase [Chlorociboria aeruginascens]|nr:Phosphatidate phosphatase/4-nitrophenylphosphatase [Chlorociboria aeruginascens]